MLSFPSSSFLVLFLAIHASGLPVDDGTVPEDGHRTDPLISVMRASATGELEKSATLHKIGGESQKYRMQFCKKHPGEFGCPGQKPQPVIELKPHPPIQPKPVEVPKIGGYRMAWCKKHPGKFGCPGQKPQPVIELKPHPVIEPKPLCKTPICDQPPKHCTVTESKEKDEKGCLMHPCGIVKCTKPVKGPKIGGYRMEWCKKHPGKFGCPGQQPQPVIELKPHPVIEPKPPVEVPKIGGYRMAWCKKHPGKFGCPGQKPQPVIELNPIPVPSMCCKAMTLSCVACAAGKSPEAYCKANPDSRVCPKHKA